MKDNERQEIEKFGQLQENGIFTMTIIGEIEEKLTRIVLQKMENILLLIQNLFLQMEE